MSREQSRQGAVLSTALYHFFSIRHIVNGRKMSNSIHLSKT